MSAVGALEGFRAIGYGHVHITSSYHWHLQLAMPPSSLEIVVYRSGGVVIQQCLLYLTATSDPNSDPSSAGW